MRNRLVTGMLTIVISLLSFTVRGQDEIVYQHPSLAIQFKASPNWKQVPHEDDKREFELVNKNNNMRVKLWITSSDVQVLEYLKQEICQDGVLTGEGPFSTIIDGHQAYGVCAICSEMRQPYRVMMIAIPCEDGMYMISFKCPEECYHQHKSDIEHLLSTVTIGPVVERQVFYAEKVN